MLIYVADLQSLHIIHIIHALRSGHRFAPPPLQMACSVLLRPWHAVAAANPRLTRLVRASHHIHNAQHLLSMLSAGIRKWWSWSFLISLHERNIRLKKTVDISRLSDRLHPSCGLPYFLGSMRIADTWQETALDEMPRPLNKEVKMRKWPNMKSSRHMLSSVPSPTLHLDHLRVVWFQYFLWTSPAETLGVSDHIGTVGNGC